MALLPAPALPSPPVQVAMNDSPWLCNMLLLPVTERVLPSPGATGTSFPFYFLRAMPWQHPIPNAEVGVGRQSASAQGL